MNSPTARNVLRLALAGLLTLIPAAATAGVVDAHWDGPGDGSGGYLANLGIDIGQTFTVEHAGTLSTVSFVVLRTADFAGPLKVDIRPVIGGFPDPLAASALFSTTVAAAQISDVSLTNLTLDVSAANIAVTPGDLLALTLSSDAAVGGARWVYTVGDPYSGGHGYFRGHADGVAFLVGGADQLFGTTVETAAEPASLLLAMPCLLAALRRRRA